MKTPLTPQEADRVFDLVAAAGALEPAQRSAFLAQACAGADRVRAEVESLLGFQHKLPGFLESPAFDRGVELLGLGADDDLQPGDTLGDYRVLALLGRGGMGEVYNLVPVLRVGGTGFLRLGTHDVGTNPVTDLPVGEGAVCPSLLSPQRCVRWVKTSSYASQKSLRLARQR